MGRLRRYGQLVSGISPHYSNVIVQPRGFPIFSDPLLKGQVRFARKTGNDFALINPDNEILLSDSIGNNSEAIQLQYPNRWLEIGAVLSLGPDVEFAVIRDFSDTQVQFTRPLTGTFSDSSRVNLYATPLYAAVSAPSGSTTLVLKSRYHILAGDKISIETTPGLLTSLLDIRVSRARLLNVVTLDAPFSLHYEVEVSQPTSAALTTGSNSHRVFLKAQPSYLSNQVFVPQVPDYPTDDIGPFLLDYVSGVLFDRPDIQEQLSITLFDKLGNTVVSDGDFPKSIGRQFQVTEMPVMADSIILWTVADGSMTFGKKGSTQELTAISICDEKGHFHTAQEVLPAMPPGTEWSVPVTSSTNATLKVTFFPNAPREFELSAAVPKQVTIGTTSLDQPTERIEIIVIGNSNTRVEFGNWVSTKNQAFSMIYGITADVFGDAQWQSTNLFCKPMFLNFAMGLKSRFNFGRSPNRFDGGLLFL